MPEREVILVGMDFAVTGNEPANVGRPLDRFVRNSYSEFEEASGIVT